VVERGGKAKTFYLSFCEKAYSQARGFASSSNHSKCVKENCLGKLALFGRKEEGYRFEGFL